MEDEPVADAATAAPEATPEAKPRNPTNSDEAPMDAVADNKPTIDDLFGDGTPGSALRDDAPASDSPMTEAPATDVPADAAPVGEPADEAPVIEEPAAEAPAAETPADAPATEEKPADVDDLFGDSKGDTPKIRRAPAVQPREALAPQGNLEPSHIEPLAAPPAGTATTPPRGKRTKVDDLFAGPEKKQPSEDAGPAMDPPVIAPNFTTPRVEAPIQAPLVPQAEPAPHAASIPAKTVSLPMRVDGVIRDWKDDTGSYGVRGRLVSILEGKVRIQKSTGKYTTVPFDRLSKGDLAYVSGMAEASGLELAIAQIKNAKK
jgi:hypothetical protein